MLRGFFTAEVAFSIVLAFIILYSSVKYKAKIFSPQGKAALKANISFMKIAVAIGMISLFIFMAVESAEIIGGSVTKYDLMLFHEIGEAVHMFLIVIALSFFLLVLDKIKRA